MTDANEYMRTADLYSHCDRKALILTIMEMRAKLTALHMRTVDDYIRELIDRERL